MKSAPPQHESRCPLAAVDRRLEDVHQHWHQAEWAYFDPEPFRVAIQTAIQTLRTVTFILQNKKAEIPNFDTWYGGWQKKLRADPLMRWMVDARNKIEKQGDLETHSFVRAEIIASYLNEGPGVELPAHLFDSLRALIERIPLGDVRQHIARHGTLRIQRRWVENTLPDYELLDAVAIAYGRINELVHDAHRQMGLPEPVTTDVEMGQQYAEGGRRGRLPCMIGHADSRSLNISLADGRPIEFEELKRTVDKNNQKDIIERYGDAHIGMFGPKGANEEDIAASLFNTARKVFLKDGYHESIFFLFKERKLVNMFVIRPETRSQKYLLMRKLSHQVTKHGADAVIHLGEMWRAPADSIKPYQHAIDSPVREEALVAELITKHGDPIDFSATISREENALTLGETEVISNPASFSFAPVYEAWGRPIPRQWAEMVKQHHNSTGSTES
jgi:hypothetical protein